MRITVSSLVRSKLVGEQVVSITWSYVLLGLILPDQPNRAVRTRMLRGVGGAPCEGCPYPDRRFNSLVQFLLHLPPFLHFQRNLGIVLDGSCE
jgi:hypothetical protein